MKKDRINKLYEDIYRDLIKLQESESEHDELEECDAGGGGTAFGDGAGAATYDASAFGKAGKSVIRKPPYTIPMSENEIKKNVIRPIVEKYLEKFLN
jgi:hypothetical protein